MKTLIRYKKGFGHFTQTHKGFGPTIYYEETLDWESGKDYFDFVDFFYAKYEEEDTYFHVKLMDTRPLCKEEKASFARYEIIRDEACLNARKAYMKTATIEPEYVNPVGD